MLTAAQNKLYWSAQRNRNGDCGWGFVCVANGWRMQDGRVAADLDEQCARSDWHRQTIIFAETLARREGHAVVINDLRHAAHWLALSRPESHAAFDNAALDRVLNIFRLLADPEDLTAVMTWNDYQQGGQPGERKRHLWFIQQTPLAYLHAILDDQQSFYGNGQCGSHRDVERFNLEKLRALTRTLKNRRAEWGRAADQRRAA